MKDFGRLEEAETSYRKAIEIKPDLAEAHISLGKLLIKKNRHIDGLNMIKKASGYVSFDVVNEWTLN